MFPFFVLNYYILFFLFFLLSYATGQCPSSSFRDPEPVVNLSPPLLPESINISYAQGLNASHPDFVLLPPLQLVILGNASEVIKFPAWPHLNETGGNRSAACPHLNWASTLSPWHDPFTWPGSVLPDIAVANGKNVTLPANKRVLLSSCSIPANIVLGYIIIPANSSLVFADANITLNAMGIIVNGGSLVIGSPFCRFSSFITISLHGRRPFAADVTFQPPEAVKGIDVSNGGSLDIHGALYSSTWSRLASTVRVNDTWIYLQELVNWEIGQEIAVIGTVLKDARDYHENEIRRIIKIKRVFIMPGTFFMAIQVNASFAFSHYAGKEYQGEVALLSRRIVVQGNPGDSEPVDVKSGCSDSTYFSSLPCSNASLTGYGGHIIIRGVQSEGRLSGVQLLRMGQTNILGRYPLHFHMMGDARNFTRGNIGNSPSFSSPFSLIAKAQAQQSFNSINYTFSSSFVQDCSVFQSFFRCFAIHATNFTRISRNTAYNAIGHCYYLEDGVEENNVIEFNLGAHIHLILGTSNTRIPSQIVSSGQQLIDYVQGPSQVLPADVSASAFYITNAYNQIVGNAASGGWAGFSFPNLATPIGPSRLNFPNFNPSSRPSLLFDGNSAHSSGFWWDQAGCMYSGGTLSFRTSDSLLVYNPGRGSSSRAFTNLTNTKVFLCNVGFMHWGSSSEFRGFEAFDFMRSATVFGNVGITQGLWQCRSANRQKSIPSGKYFENRFFTNSIGTFQWYDTFQSHVITNVTIRDCKSSGTSIVNAWQFLTHSDQFVPDVMQMTRAIKYENVSPVGDLLKFTVISRTTISGRLQSWVDFDGSASLRAFPGKSTLIGSSWANDWWRLHTNNTGAVTASDGVLNANFSGCSDRPDWRLILCDAALVDPSGLNVALASNPGDPNMVQLGSVKLIFDKPLQSNIGNGICGNGDGQPCPVVGTVRHVGMTDYLGNSARGLDLGANARITGPASGFGWFVTFTRGAPKNIEITEIQIFQTAIVTLVFRYPLSTTGVDVTAVAPGCPSGVNWCLGRWPFRSVSSANAVRNFTGPGDLYYFDRSRGLVYLRITSHRNWNLGVNNVWAIKNVPTMEPFTFDGISIPARNSWDFRIEISAGCAATIPTQADTVNGMPVYCALENPQPLNAGEIVPPSPCEEFGNSFKQDSFASCRFVAGYNGSSNGNNNNYPTLTSSTIFQQTFTSQATKTSSSSALTERENNFYLFPFLLATVYLFQ